MISITVGGEPILGDARGTWEGFRVNIKGDRMRRSENHGTDGDFHDRSCTVELETDSGTVSAYSKDLRFTEGEGGNGNSRAIKRLLFELVVYVFQEERIVAVHPRFAICEHFGNWTDSG